jgi:hypothetical protein
MDAMTAADAVPQHNTLPTVRSTLCETLAAEWFVALVAAKPMLVSGSARHLIPMIHVVAISL